VKKKEKGNMMCNKDSSQKTEEEEGFINPMKRGILKGLGER